jgi:hypothetical protein
VTEPVAQGKYAARFEVRPGDNPVCCGDRAEISTGTAETEGMERYYEWWTRFDKSFPNASWQAVAQWHSGIDGVPPVAFYAEDGRFRMQTWPRDGGGNNLGGPHELWNVPLQRDSWYHIVMHVKWSSDDKVGFIEMNVNGKQVVPKAMGRTMLPGSGNYFKQGYYRAFGIGQTGVIYHDGFRVTQVSP